MNSADQLDAATAKRIVVIGGGISGLAAAFFARELAARRRLPAQVVLLEERPRLGGMVETVYRDEFLMEGGPDSFITEKPWLLSLAGRLGLESEVVSTREENRRAYVVCKGRLAEIPPGFFLLGPARLSPLLKSSILSPRGKVRAALDLLLPRGAARTDESVASFVIRRFGRETLERLAEPLASAIYGTAPERLSLKATVPRFLELEQSHRSVIMGLRRLARARAAGAREVSGARLGLFASFKKGMATLVEALAAALGDSVWLGAGAATLVRERERWRVEVSGTSAAPARRAIEADAVVIAAPAPEAARLLKPHAASAAKLLEQIAYGCAAQVTMAYRTADVRALPHGSGFVVPRVEGRRIGACTFASLKFPERAPGDYLLARAFIDGGGCAALRTMEDSELGRAARADLEELLGIGRAPLFCHVTRLDRAMPQYVVGHRERVDSIEHDIEGLRGLRLCGAAYRGIGLPDCVRSGELAAVGVIDSLCGREHPALAGSLSNTDRPATCDSATASGIARQSPL